MLLIDERLGDLQGLHLRHGLAVSLCLPGQLVAVDVVVGALGLALGAHRRDLSLQDGAVVGVAADRLCARAAARLQGVMTSCYFLAHIVCSDSARQLILYSH